MISWVRRATSEDPLLKSKTLDKTESKSNSFFQGLGPCVGLGVELEAISVQEPINTPLALPHL